MEVVESFDQQERLRALARSMIYGGLALGFRYPERKVRSSLVKQRLFDELQGCCIVLQCGHCIQYLTKLRSNLPPEHLDIELAYLAAFENVRGDNQFCRLNEGDYRSEIPRGDLLVELKGLYQHFGLTISEKQSDLPDRIDTELEFMHFLTHKQVEAIESGEDQSAYIKAQRDFQKNHLVSWVSEMVTRSEKCIQEPFYRSWVELTGTFVEHDAR